MEPLLETIVRHVPPPEDRTADAFAMLVAMVEHDSFLGRVATGRVAAGQAKAGDRVRVLHHSGPALAPPCTTLGTLDGRKSNAAQGSNTL